MYKYEAKRSKPVIVNKSRKPLLQMKETYVKQNLTQIYKNETNISQRINKYQEYIKERNTLINNTKLFSLRYSLSPDILNLAIHLIDIIMMSSHDLESHLVMVISCILASKIL
jgi:CMP-N-acetylneuraminic acid synthetase